MTAAIVARDLRRTFGGFEAVAGVDLDVQPGEIYGFLGPNGAGKSTTVKMLCTLLSPTSGAATVAGFDVERNAGEVRLRIGVAPTSLGPNGGSSAPDRDACGLADILPLGPSYYRQGLQSVRRPHLTQLSGFGSAKTPTY